ncbi:MAG: tRNA (N6-threonylcarbamoyladenosine(37)-N6)-methyltransferase TrmO [bacterium]|nr:tRNA (N6-threonylcarbamoyladenosine(37)-N6)-methyltransferase TrmO [bacterium]
MQGQTITFKPIGIIHSPFKQSAGTPIQSVLAPQAEGTVEVFEEFAEGLGDVDAFSHLHLLYAFDRARTPTLTCVPFLDDKPRGVFATRAPARPNGLGLSIVRLVRREGSRLRVRELDILDGTPLLDIKPFVPRFDARPEATSGWVPSTLPDSVGGGADDRFSR